eukprot:841547-Pleurochrysis_carterae.AAC.1
MVLKASRRVTGLVAIGTDIDDSVRGGTVIRTPKSECTAAVGAGAALPPGLVVTRVGAEEAFGRRSPL